MTDQSNMPPNGKWRASTGIGPIEKKTKYFIEIWDKESPGRKFETSFEADHPNSIQEMGRRKFTHERQAVYLNHLAKYGVQSKAALVAGVLPQTVQRCAKEDSDFREAQLLAQEIWRANAEERIVTEALDGHLDIRRDKEGNVLSERKILEPRLREMILKRVNKEYVETQKSEVAVTGGAVIVPPPTDVEDWQATVAKWTGKPPTVDTEGTAVTEPKLGPGTEQKE